MVQDWQTRLYLYTLVKTSNYLPEAVSMTYWFIPPKNQQLPCQLKFSYNQQLHQKAEQDLQQILNNLTEWLNYYQQEKVEFPQVESLDTCYTCQFASRCQRFSEVQHQQEYIQSIDIDPSFILNLEDIPEISI